LNYCQSIEANLHHNNKNFKHVFSIRTTKRTYYLVAETREEMDKWVKHLCKCCGFEKQDGKPSPGIIITNVFVRGGLRGIHGKNIPSGKKKQTQSPLALLKIDLHQY